MPLDPYAPCPGGRDKKIRFCCPNLTKELEQIEEMLEAGQSAAAVAFIEKLEVNHPNCACLMAAQCSALRLAGRWDEYRVVAKRFAAAEPENLRAISESLLSQLSDEEAEPPVSELIDAFEKTEAGQIYPMLLLPAELIALSLLEAGNILPAIALLRLVQAYAPQNEKATALLQNLYADRSIPLTQKEYFYDAVAPADFEGAAAYRLAVEWLSLGHWKKAQTKLESLLPGADSWPSVWRTLALVRFWLGDEEGGIDGLNRFATAEKTPYADAVDAETFLLQRKESEESNDVSFEEFTVWVEEFDRLLERILSTPEMVSIPVDPQLFDPAAGPAPSHIFHLLDRPFPPKNTPPDVSNTPVQLGTCSLYGRETDRAARLEISTFDVEKSKLDELLARVGDGLVGTAGPVEVRAQIPWVMYRARRQYQFKPESGVTPEQLEAFFTGPATDDFIADWLARPFSILGGKTPSDAANDPALSRKLAGLIVWTEWGVEDSPIRQGMADRLRQAVGVAPPEKIELPSGSDEAQLAALRTIPVWRWNRLNLDALSAKSAGRLLSMVMMFKEGNLVVLLAEKVLSAPPVRDELEARRLAYEILIELATSSGRIDEAVSVLSRGYDEAQAFGVSDGSLHLRELMLRLMANQAAEFQKLISHIARDHKNEPQTMAALQDMLVRLGVLRPDGSMPSFSQGGAGPVPPNAAPPHSPYSASPEPKNSGLWTPGGDEGASGSSSSGPSRLWTPD